MGAPLVELHQARSKRGSTSEAVLPEVGLTFLSLPEHHSHINRNINRVSYSLQRAGEEVERQMLFKSFFIWGGPSHTEPGTVEAT